MTPISMRTTAISALAAVAAAGALLLPASPAAAAPPIDGNIGSFAYGKTNQAGCTDHPGPINKNRAFSSATGKRTAKVERSFRAEESGTVSARGRVENRSTAVADADNGAFDTVRFTASQLVRVNDTNAGLDCKLGVLADTQSGADLKVNRNGRVRLEWDRGRAGQIEQILVSRNGNPVVDKIRPSRHGGTTFNVTPGTYLVFVQFQTRANETDIPAGTQLTKRARFKVELDYRRR